MISGLLSCNFIRLLLSSPSIIKSHTLYNVQEPGQAEAGKPLLPESELESIDSHGFSKLRYLGLMVVF